MGAPSVALVLPGGGCRGAYEVGALSVLLPELERRGERVSIVCGTSVGAINAALVGSLAHLPAEQAAAEAVNRWRDMRKGDVIRPIVHPRTLLTAVRFLGETLELPRIRLPSVLDPAPLHRNLDRWIDWLSLHRNVRRRTVDAVCVVATEVRHGAVTAFVETGRNLPAGTHDDELTFARCTVGADHVLASAAIPVLFPPVAVTRPSARAGHYFDGGTRLNSPIKPAIALGADRVVIVAFDPPRNGSMGAPAAASNGHRPAAITAAAEPGPADRPQRPDLAAHAPAPQMADVAANVLDGLLVDQLEGDLARLTAINSFFADGPSGPAHEARAYRTARGRPPFRRIRHALITPERRGELGELAERVFADRYGGVKALRDLDFGLMSRILGRASRSRGELLSFLFFDETYVDELLAAGARDARRWLDAHPGLWANGSAQPRETTSPNARRVTEEAALREFRERRWR